jgi:hypothetical protein
MLNLSDVDETIYTNLTALLAEGILEVRRDLNLYLGTQTALFFPEVFLHK